MRIIVTILTYFLLSFSTTAQVLPVDTFFTAGSQWTLAYSYILPTGGGHSGGYGIKRIQYRVEADTFVAGVRYHPISLWEGGGYGISGSVPYVSTSTHFRDRIGRIRIEGEKVYFTEDSDDPNFVHNEFITGLEYLLYDFSLNVTDTFNYPTVSITQTYTVISVDTVSDTLSTGIRLKKHILEDHPSTQVWLRGIGSFEGIVSYYAFQFGYAYSPVSISFLCYDHPSFYYRNPEPGIDLMGDLENNCFDVSTLHIRSITQKDPIVLSIFPNPVTDGILHISSQQPQDITRIEVYDITDKQLLSLPGPFRGTHISIPSPPNAGTYFLKIGLSDNRVETRMFTKM